jgi:hypothetical protein
MNLKLQHVFIRAGLATVVSAIALVASAGELAVKTHNAISATVVSNIPKQDGLEAGGFASANEAAGAFAKAYAAKSGAQSVEFNAGIVRSSDGTFGYASPVSGPTSATTVNVSDYHRTLRDQFGDGYVALAHTSLDNDTRFSPVDANDATIMPIYQVLGSGQTWLLDKNIVRNRLREDTIQGPGPLRVYLQRHEGMSGECVNSCG